MDSDKWFTDCANKSFFEGISSICNNVYDYLENKRAKNDKVTSPVVNNVKKALDYILLKCAEVNTDYSVLKARLEDRADFQKSLKDLAEGVARTSVSSQEDRTGIHSLRKTSMRDDYNLMLTMKDKDVEIENIKGDIKNIFKENTEFPGPRDVVVTKNGQLILKYSDKTMMEKAKECILAKENIKDTVNVMTPTRRRERLIILNTDPEIEESTVKSALEEVLVEDFN